MDGIFLDEASNDCAKLAYYQAVIAYIKAKSCTATTAINWGTDGPECYLSSPNAPDIVLNYENTYDNYLKWTGPPAWTAKYNASRYEWVTVGYTAAIHLLGIGGRPVQLLLVRGMRSGPYKGCCKLGSCRPSRVALDSCLQQGGMLTMFVKQHVASMQVHACVLVGMCTWDKKDFLMHERLLPAVQLQSLLGENALQ